MKGKRALNASEMYELLGLLKKQSQSIRFSLDPTTGKLFRYEQMLRIIEQFDEYPEMVRERIELARKWEQYGKNTLQKLGGTDQ